MQLDVHDKPGADDKSWNNASTIATVFRDAKGVAYVEDAWVAIGGTGESPVTPLHADDPKQIPFRNDQDQTENRWVVMLRMQVDQMLTLPQEFADELEVTLIPADSYPTS